MTKKVLSSNKHRQVSMSPRDGAPSSAKEVKNWRSPVVWVSTQHRKAHSYLSVKRVQELSLVSNVTQQFTKNTIAKNSKQLELNLSVSNEQNMKKDNRLL
jgi:hypothetical protein